MNLSIRYLRKLAACVVGIPIYSSRWNISTRCQSIPGVDVSDSKKSSCEAPVAAMIRTVSEWLKTRRSDCAACRAAASPTSSLLRNTFTYTFPPPQPRKHNPALAGGNSNPPALLQKRQPVLSAVFGSMGYAHSVSTRGLLVTLPLNFQKYYNN